MKKNSGHENSWKYICYASFGGFYFPIVPLKFFRFLDTGMEKLSTQARQLCIKDLAGQTFVLRHERVNLWVIWAESMGHYHFPVRCSLWICSATCSVYLYNYLISKMDPAIADFAKEIEAKVGLWSLTRAMPCPFPHLKLIH